MFEKQISRLETSEAKKQIDNLSKSLGGFSEKTNKYERLPLYQTMINTYCDCFRSLRKVKRKNYLQ